MPGILAKFCIKTMKYERKRNANNKQFFNLIPVLVCAPLLLIYQYVCTAMHFPNQKRVGLDSKLNLATFQLHILILLLLVTEVFPVQPLIKRAIKLSIYLVEYVSDDLTLKSIS